MSQNPPFSGENCDIFTPHLCLAPPQGVTPSEFREYLDIHKTRMNGLSCGEESLTIYSAVLIQCQRVTDGWTDGRTDVQTISITCFSIAHARKNEWFRTVQTWYRDITLGNQQVVWFWVERSKVKIRVRVNSNMAWVRTLWVPTSCYSLVNIYSAS